MSKLKFIRPQSKALLRRLREPRRFIQALTGPRQAGKTTLARQAALKSALPFHFAGADEPGLRPLEWIEAQWEVARRLTTATGRKKKALLILDEIQKAPGWAEAVKRLWDEDTRHSRPLQVILLGSAPLLVGRGLTESLAGRFESLPLPHWSFSEMREAFSWTLDQHIFYGAYPGAAPLIREPARWAAYIRDSLIETTVSRDVLLLSRVDKPALLRRLFALGCSYSGQIISYNKIMGQLQSAGNTTTLAHYLDLLEAAGMLSGLMKYTGSEVRRRSSSPKMQALNTALVSALSGMSFSEARANREFWGRLTESAVGAHLVNGSVAGSYKVFYWRERNQEVDFILSRGRRLVAVEVKSRGARARSLSGLRAFSVAYPKVKKLIVGGDGMEIGAFLSKPPESWL